MSDNTPKGAINIYNQLTLWYSNDKAASVRAEIVEKIKKQYGFSDAEIEQDGDCITFLYDEETDGHIAISFKEEKDSLRVTVEGTWSWETIEIYQNILPQSAEEDPA